MAFMAAAMPYLAAGGAGISALGAVQQGNIAKATSDYNAQLAEQNAVLAESQDVEEERRFRVSTTKQLGSMRAAYAKSGVTLEGSPMAVLADSAYTAELDALTIREGGQARKAAYESEAQLTRLQGEQQQTASYYSAASELLGGATDYYRMTRT